MYLCERQNYIERRRFCIGWFTPQLVTKARAKNCIQVSHVGCRCRRIIFCLPRCITREFGWKWKNLDLNQYSYTMQALHAVASCAAWQCQSPWSYKTYSLHKKHLCTSKSQSKIHAERWLSSEGILVHADCWILDSCAVQCRGQCLACRRCVFSELISAYIHFFP